jgi:hypothetical protein|tara:strand:+ start:163 stop:765 length:603 start_codon:yes stop_codon:yes gene_type:complete
MKPASILNLATRPGNLIATGGVAALFALQRLVWSWNAWLERSHKGHEQITDIEPVKDRAVTIKGRARSLSDAASELLVPRSFAYRPLHTAAMRGTLRQRGVNGDRLASVRPRSWKDLARGFGSVFAFLGAVDVLHAYLPRRDGPRDPVGRFYALHAVANAVIVLASWRDALRGLLSPVEHAVGPAKILVPYVISGLFAYQ